MTKYRQRKKNALKEFKRGSDERYWRTHCAICEKHMDIVRDKYFNKYGFCSVKCGMEMYGMKEGDFYGYATYR